jgi:LuxR family maltose regulon positive regulatory protein
VLVLDDFHVIEAADVHRGLTFLLEHLPHQLRIVIGTRADPPLPLARLRAHAQLGELRVNDLRLTMSEMERFLKGVMELDLTPGQLEQLEARTEGWLVGLQLAALSMRGRADLETFVAAFAGSHRFVVDYLIEDVLQREPEDMQSFLHETAILERLTAGVCDAVTGGENGEVMLDRAERENLFLVPLDDERQWYRYHPLFAEALRQRLRRGPPDRLHQLHGRASRWFSDHAMHNEAIEHALAAEDWARAAGLINSIATRLIEHGEHATLDRWLGVAPRTLYGALPLLSVRAAEARALLGDFSGAETLLDELESRAPPAEPSTLGYAAALRTRIAVLRDDGGTAIRYGQRALDLLPAADASARAGAMVELGSGWLLNGELDAAEPVLQDALVAARQANNKTEEWVTLVRLARLDIDRGRLHSAAARFQAILDATTDLRVMPRTAAEYRLGALKYEWNQLEAASLHVERAIGLDERTTGRRLLGSWLWRVRADVLLGRGDLAGARVALEQAIAAAERLQNVPEQRRLRAAVARVGIMAGDLSVARAWASQVESGESGWHAGHEDELLVRARLSLAEGAPLGAVKLLLEPTASFLSKGMVSAAIRFVVVLAVAQAELGDSARARAALEEALDLGERGGYVRTFVDEGPPMLRLLRGYKGASTYVGSLVRAFGGQSHDALPMKDAPSERELEVLRLIAQGLDNLAIAAQLVISVNTVKSHTHHLMNKLDANNRVQLVARAHELQLLP